MPRRCLRIAVLECDTPPEQTNRKYGGYHGVFSKFLRESADTLAQADNEGVLELAFSRWDVVTEQAYPALAEVDAIVVSGSKHNSFDSHLWILKLVAFIQRALATPHIRILGICFGHQIIARALGMDVFRNPAGWEIAVCPVDLTEAGKGVFGVEGLQIHQMHRDAVRIPASPLDTDITPLGRSDVCEVQGMYSPGRFITVQGHPEFTEDIVEEIITLRAKQGVFDREQAEDALSRAKRPHDGIKVGVAFLRMVIG
ncbi:class I glutamine amidotransferase-like protein [Aspergillus granulosus]|uniref:Class I glutamine amidotransferase-like protein n=1 Tax=Aspergillus granulosus TaxID=176169 RepID=A0ABR4I0B9_9EURO